MGVTQERALKRYWSKVSYGELPPPFMTQPCWKWTAGCDPKGNPRFKYRGKNMCAYRAYLTLIGKRLGPDKKVVSICHNKLCVNPAHHVIGTDQDVVALSARGPLGPDSPRLFRNSVQEGLSNPISIAKAMDLNLTLVEAIVAEGVPEHHNL